VQLTAANILGCSSTQPAAADRCGHHSVALGELQLAQPNHHLQIICNLKSSVPYQW